MVSLNLANPLLNTRIGTVMPQSMAGGAQGSQSLKDVIDKLTQALTQGSGHLDQDSPLGKMVGKQMDKMFPLAALGGGSADMVKAALGEVIKDKLGDNFGAASNLGLSSGSGQSDMMSQVLNGLAKSSLDELLSKQGDGTKFSESDMPLLDKVAEFMDQNPSKFPAPDSGSWKNELKEDNFLDGKETDAFRAALDTLGSQLAQQQNGQDASGGLGTPINDAAQPGVSNSEDNSNSVTADLAKLLAGLIEKGLEATQGNQGSNAGGSAPGTQQPDPRFARHDLQSSAAQAATAIVSALLGAGNSSVS